MRNKVLPSHQVSFAFHCYRKFNKRDTCPFVLNWFFYLGTKVEAKTSGNFTKLGKIRNFSEYEVKEGRRKTLYVLQTLIELLKVILILDI